MKDLIPLDIGGPEMRKNIEIEKEKYFPDLSENMQKLLKQAYIFCYGEGYKNEMAKR